MSFEERLKTGQLGERIVDEFLRQKGWIPYYPPKGVAHPFDRLAASPDKRNICIVEVKTKHRREAYADTGIDRRHFNDYQCVTMKYSVPLFLVFVDSKEGKIYGHWWHELIKSREPDDKARRAGCASYPWDQNGIVYFPRSIMREMHVLSDDDRSELLKLRVSQWKDNPGA